MKKMRCALSFLLAGLLLVGTFVACKEPNAPAQTGKQTETDKPSETDKPTETDASGTSKPADSGKPPVDTEKPTTDTKKPSRPEKPAIEGTAGLEYQLLEDGTYEVSGVGTAGNLSKIVIPAIYNGKAVTIIGDKAFSGCKTLTSITIPDSVTIIYSNAFFGCTNLIQKEKGVGYVDKWAIDCEASTISVSLRDGTVGIADFAFYECKNLTGITLPDSVKCIGYFAFGGCMKLGRITIPDGVISIDGHAFEGCRGLMSITIPDSVISIGIDAFSGCTGLTSITIPDGVTSIDAFSGCTGLRSITIPDSVTQIGMYAFDGCENLAHIVIPNGVTEIGYGTFRNCSALTGLTIPNSVTSIAFDAFDGCTKLIQKENGVSYVDKWMIGCDASVTFVALRDGTVGIAKQAFNNCDALTGIVIPNSVVRINSAALNGCSRLDHITYLGTEKQWNAVIKDPVWNINWCETVYFSEDYTKKFTPITEKTVYVVSGSIAPLRYEPVPSENGQGGGAIVGGNSVPCGTALTAVAEGTVNGVSWYKVYYKKDAGSASIGCYVAKSEVSEVRPADAGYTLEELIEKYHYTKFSSEITAYPYQNSINVRETPSASGKLVETVALPSSLTLYAYGESLSGGATWCLVKTKDGKIGFAWYDSLTLDSTGKALSNIPLSLDHLLSVYKFTRTSATKTASVEVKLWSEPSGDESKVVKKISQGTSVTVVAEGKGTNGRDGYYIVEVEGTYYFALQSAFN